MYIFSDLGIMKQPVRRNDKKSVKMFFLATSQVRFPDNNSVVETK